MKYIKNNLILLLISIISTQAMAGGIMIVSPAGTNWTGTQRMNPFSLNVKSLRVETTINDNIAHTVITQVFNNPTPMRLQGFFLFPVPENSIISNFQMDINGKLTKAELLDAAQARKVYEDIVRKTLDPALLEYSNSQLFKIRVFPIEPGKDKTIKISYNTVLQSENNLLSYTLPLNTQKFSAQPLKNVVIHFKIKNKNALSNVYSPTHRLDGKALDEHNWEAGFEQKEIKPNTDLKLYIQKSANQINISALGFKGDETKGFVLFSISPDFYSKQTEAKDYIFVLDVSGSMRDEKIKQARKALQYCVKKLKSNDKFQVIKFSTFSEKMFENLVSGSEANKTNAIKKIENWEAVGGTNMEAAFKDVFSKLPQDKRKKVVVFITDGKPTIGEINETKLVNLIQKNNSQHIRIFTFGLGSDLNTHLLDKIALKTNAYHYYINQGEKIDHAIAAFFDKVIRPAISNLKFKVENATISQLTPHEIPDLFYGQSIVLVAKIDKEGQITAKLSGELNGKLVSTSQKLSLKFGSKNEYIPQIWASMQLGYLLEQIRLHGETKELKDEIVHLAKKYGIITPYTSYLIMEDEVVVTHNPHPHHYPPIRVRKILDEQFDMEEAADEYTQIQNKSGGNSTRSSSEIQDLKKSKGTYNSSMGQSRMLKKQNSNKVYIQNRQGRAFYKSEKGWTDTQLIDTPSQKAKQIKFASKEYFKLIENNPQIGQYLSVGRKCQFVYNHQIYDIIE